MDIPPLLFPNVEDLERALALPDGFVDRLLEEDDWSFVVKAHALVEGAIAHLIEARLDSVLARFSASLPFAAGRSSQLGLVEAYGLLDSPTVRFIRDLGVLRNRLAHDVRETGFTFRRYVDSLSTAELRDVSLKFTRPFDLHGDAEIEAARSEFMRLGPRQVVMFATMAAVSRAYYAAYPSKLNDALEQFAQSKPAIFLAGLLVLIAMTASARQAPPNPGSSS